MRLKITGNKKHGFSVSNDDNCYSAGLAISPIYKYKENAYRWAIRYVIKKIEKALKTVIKHELDYELTDNYYSITVDSIYMKYMIYCNSKEDGHKKILKHYLNQYNKINYLTGE